MHTPKEEAYASYGSGVAEAALGAAFASASHRGAVAASLENCMVVMGWRVVRVTGAEGAALANLPPADLAARLQPWLGAATPHGEIVRTWNNDAARAATIRYGLDASHTNNGQLSLRAATAGSLTQFVRPEPQPDRSSSKIDPMWPTKRLKPSELASVPAEGGVIIVWTKGLNARNGAVVSLSRIGSDGTASPSKVDHRPDRLVAGLGLLFVKKDNIFAFAAPAGRWRIDSFGGMGRLSFCMGAPSFELKPGEVVFAGTFDLSAENIGPDMSLEPIKAWLAGQAAANTVRPAEYTNGSVGACGGIGTIYALEIPGAPFEPGYQWGSRAELPTNGAR